MNGLGACLALDRPTLIRVGRQVTHWGIGSDHGRVHLDCHLGRACLADGHSPAWCPARWQPKLGVMPLLIGLIAPPLAAGIATLAIVLMLLSAPLLVAEAHLSAHGVLGACAAASLTAGVVLTLSGAGLSVVAVVAAGVTVGLAGLALSWLLLTKSLAAHRLAVRSGRRALVGRVATVRVAPRPLGQVQLDGALWRARLWELEGEGAPLAEGSIVVVESIDGLTLTVRPAEEWEMNSR